ncbi:ParB/RepB/Spo0J family partition protein [Gluconobacter oxydans]|uniref:ParB/RepB/Spo0J family partition protein n=1 Tax=Gluconobacter oxydans TaxID=442 RepID=A0AB35ARI1_GLUOY|nr:ParB/RepB/Spo0J family partition protein [Gluconobacter oxydans]MBF0856556.1 ParB/RepB/Spo0J family partition protein [Gluconobacter oxydans]TCW25560.1 ParB/RepB/Spo0J family partition protein [Gluconobacter oxydans]
MAELRRVDPKTLVPNPNNPRSSIGSLEELRKLALNIKAIGILHPPAVRELEDGRLMIVAGHRRAQGAIYAGLPEIDVYVGDQSDDLDALAAVSENFVRLDMTEPEQWNSVTRLREELGYTDPQVCSALMVTPTYLKRLSLLAKLHPPILDAIALGRGPDDRQRKILAQASLEEQRDAWAEMYAESVEDGEDPAEYRLKADDPEDTVAWGALARNLEQREWYARDARFGDDLARKHNIVWMEDLFAEPGTDSRYTLDATAYAAAQQDWLDNERPESSIVLTTDEYGYIRAPEGFITMGTWMATQEGEVMGYGLNPRNLKIVEERCRPSVAFTQSHANGSGEPAAPKERPDVSGTGHKMIGEIRTVALREALGEVAETADPWELIAALLLALEAENVRVLGDASGNNWSEPTARTLAMANLFPEGGLVRDEKLIRRHAVSVLQSILNCEVSMHSGSGLPAQLVGILFGADQKMPSMAFEPFLKCYSKSGITKAVQAEGLAPQNTGKEMRAALMNYVGEGHWLPEVASFAQAQDVWTQKQKKKQQKIRELESVVDDEDLDEVPEDDFDGAADDEADLSNGPVVPVTEPDSEKTFSLEAPEPEPSEHNEAMQFMRDHLEIVVVA